MASFAQDEKLTNQEICDLVFHAGLSTAEKVTDVSGRGVGMDVVRRNIEELKGSVTLVSEPGVGTTVTVRLPLDARDSGRADRPARRRSLRGSATVGG